MNTKHFTHFTPVIRAFNGDVFSPGLHVATEGRITVQYAPFEWVNPDAKLVIVGITPGETQAVNAIVEAKRQLLTGANALQAMIAAKRIGGFSGALRANLVAMLDRVGLPRWAGIGSSIELFGRKADLLQTASVLPYPVFVDGNKRYNGSPPLLRSPMLRSMVLKQFVPIVQALPSAKLLAVGDVSWETLNWLAQQGEIDSKQILGYLPHPSPASQERVNYFLGRKLKADLSKQTDAEKLDRMRQQLEQALTHASAAA